MRRYAVRFGLVGTAVLAGLLATAPAGAEIAIRTCNVPTVAHERTLSAAQAGSAPLGSSVALPVPPATTSTSIDLDGDGTADELTAPTDTSQAIARSGGGVVTLTDLPPGVRFTTGQASDLDGDGRDDLWDTFATPGTQGHQATAVLPGTTEAGSHVTGLAVLVFRGTVVGDVTGDGLDDARVVTTPSPIAPQLATTHHQTLVGALVAGDGPHALPSDVARLSARADLDLDGIPDRLYQWLGPDDGGPGGSAVVLSTVDEPLALLGPDGEPHTYPTIRPARVGTTTRLATLAPSPSTAPEERWTVANTCARSWLGRASRWVLDAQPTDDAALGGLDPTAPLTPAQRRALARSLVRSTAGRTVLVDQRFQTALHRDADPAGITYWVGALGAGRRSAEQLTAHLFGSGEFYAAHGSTLDGWVVGLYQQGADQVPDPGGAAYWKGVAQREGRERAAARFFATPGARRALVAAVTPGEYVLARPADPSGLERGVRLLGTGGWDALQVELLASDEFYLKAQSSNRLRPS